MSGKRGVKIGLCVVISVLFVLGVLGGYFGVIAQQTQEQSAEQLNQLATAALSEESSFPLLLEERIDLVRENNRLIAAREMLTEILRYVFLGVLVYFVPKIISLLLEHSNFRSAADTVTIAGIVLIIFAIVSVVIVVDDDKQLTTSIGVLGTIAGYLFGTVGRYFRSDGGRRTEIQPNSEKKPSTS